MEYNDSDRGRELAAQVREFVNDVIIPVERDHLGDGPISSDQLEELREEARDRGIYAPQVSTEYGEMGIEFRDVLPSFEEAGRSLLAPPAIRVDAPDEGNMHTFELVGTEERKEQ